MRWTPVFGVGENKDWKLTNLKTEKRKTLFPAWQNTQTTGKEGKMEKTKNFPTKLLVAFETQPGGKKG